MGAPELFTGSRPSHPKIPCSSRLQHFTLVRAGRYTIMWMALVSEAVEQEKAVGGEGREVTPHPHARDGHLPATHNHGYGGLWSKCTSRRDSGRLLNNWRQGRIYFLESHLTSRDNNMGAMDLRRQRKFFLWTGRPQSYR